MNLDLRIVFLFFLGLTAFLFILRRGPVMSLGDFFQIIIDFVLVLAVGGTVISFVFLLTRQDPMPLLRNLGYQTSLQQLVSFEYAVPQHLEQSLAATNIMREDTDGDDYKEWVVFYEFDLRNGTGPVKAVIYDNDRGDPPVIFPYALRPPNRDYLSEGSISLDMRNVTLDNNGPDGRDLNEILTHGQDELGIFRFRENSELWDFPRDAPPRYQSIGFFRGSGGVNFDDTSKNVTVLDRAGYERSQLVKRSVYGLNPATNTYWDQFYNPAELDRKLAAPVVSTIDFYGSPPDNIFETTYPEKVVLAFYAANCGGSGPALCRNSNTGWAPRDFLDPTSDAFFEYQNDNASYFGLTGFGSLSDISVSYLRYYPQIETDQDLLVTGGGRDVVTGEEAQFNVVDVIFAITGDPNLTTREETARYAMTQVGGQWKISYRLPLDMPELGAPTQIPANE